MAEGRVYVENRESANFSRAWFTLPIQWDEVYEKIGHAKDIDSYIVLEYDLPFDIPEELTLSKAERYYLDMFELIKVYIKEEDVRAVQKKWFKDFEDLYYSCFDVLYYPGLHSMEELARYMIDEGLEGWLKFRVKEYIDYADLGQSFEKTGKFLIASGGIYRYVH